MLRRSASPRVFDRGLQLSGREDGRTAWARKATGRGASRSNSKEATRQPGAHSLRQQERSDTFVRAFNAERPREALDMKCPAELYLASSRRYDGLPELLHPFHDLTLASTGNRRNTRWHWKGPSIALIHETLPTMARWTRAGMVAAHVAIDFFRLVV